MKQLLTPKQVATSLGVSESSLKRWCDRGVIASERTPGGHRRIPIGEVIRFLRDQNRPLADPGSLGLPTDSGMPVRSVDGSIEALNHSLMQGDLEQSRRVVIGLYLDGNSVERICTKLFVPLLHDIGDSWECGNLEVYQEHRACEILGRLLYEIRTLLPAPAATAPTAFGGSLSGDHYWLASLMVELILTESGLRAQTLGSSLPMETLTQAVRQHHPAVIWLSCSHLEDPEATRKELAEFLEETPSSTRVLIGGSQADPSFAHGTPRVVYCPDLASLRGAVADLLPAE